MRKILAIALILPALAFVGCGKEVKKKADKCCECKCSATDCPCKDVYPAVKVN